MRMICVLFFTIVLSRTYPTNAEKGNEDYEAIIDTKVVDYDDSSEQDFDKTETDSQRGVKNLNKFVGTNLFGVDGSRNRCFSSEDVALLSARRDFESLIPKDLPNCLLDDELVAILMQYFSAVHQAIDKMAGGHVKTSVQKVFYDTLGGYLNYYLIPISRYSYYAGLLKLKTVDSISDLYSQCKSSINTNGKGWRTPLSDFSELDTQVEPLRIVIYGDAKDTSCLQLDLLDEQSGEDEDMLVPLPCLDPEEKGLLGNIWLPFKRKRVFDLRSDMSAFVFLRYFELTTRCYYSQAIRQDSFNKRLKEWILENLEVHLVDEILYPGLGAVMRVAETTRRNNKGSIIELPRTPSKQKTTNFLKVELNANKLKKSWLDKDYPEKSRFSKTNKDNHLNYTSIYFAIGIAVLILFVVFLGIGLVVLRRILSRKYPERRKNPKEGDEETLISSSSPRTSTELLETRGFKVPQAQLPTQDFRDSRSKSNGNNDAAIIETSSMDSDSPRIEKPKQQQEIKPKPSKPTKHKEIIVDEKKRFIISKKKKLQRMEEKKIDKAKKETW